MTTLRAGAPSRRAVLRVGAAASCGAVLTGGVVPPLLGSAAAATTPAPTRYAYGSASDLQHGDLWLPSGTPTALVVLLHGGAFQASYHSSEMNPIASTLAAGGYAVWNVEYRSVGTGGGFPNTFIDAAKAIDIIRGTPYDKDVVLVGYSAGGILAAWAASRTSATPGGAPRQPLKAVITLSGGLDLSGLASYPGLSQQMIACMGGTPKQVPARYAVADPTLLLPPRCPVGAVQADHDGVVPPDEARTYVAKAKAAGGAAVFVSVPGTHATIRDPAASSWPTIAALIKKAATG